MRKFGKILAISQIVILVFWIVLAGSPSQASAQSYTSKVREKIDVADGMLYKDIRLKGGNLNQAVRVMEINVANPTASVEVGVSPNLNQLQRTSTLANSYSTKNSWTVGAINASFFWQGVPMNLVSKDNKLVHSGEVFSGKDKYVNEPIAFGIDKNGKGVIDHYSLNMTYKHDGVTYPIYATNQARNSNQTILYTPDFPSKTTNTNSMGTEVVVTLPSPATLEFGSTVTGKVVSIRKEGDAKSATIPANGFVLSGSRGASEKLQKIEVGDEISVSVNVDNKWFDSEFMVASGPMLVKDGKVSMTMDPNSSNARTRAPRTAVAIDKTGQKVFFVTVDGRQSGYSNGMNLTEFANYLVQLGAYRALNLDGGGSTTMAARLPGSNAVKVMNSPSDKTERYVSTILMAKSTGPMPVFIDVPKNYWARSAIMDLYNRGTITGFPGGEFRPNASITRTQAAIMLTRQLGLDTKNIKNPGFKDVATSYKYYPQIAAAANAKLFNGRDGNKFAPNGILTRGEMAVLLQRSYGLPKGSKGNFPDVPKKHYAYDAINGMAEAGLTSGYPDGSFKPNQPVTRAEFSAFLERVQPAGKFMTVKNIGSDNLNVRSQPSTSGSIIGKLKSYDTVTVLVDANGKPIMSGDWYSILLNGKKGWVHKDYVS
ncbi:S-layer homology domain-containing protein [Ornithinibacillus scapharcae]|uniref:S-layer homology domain-containing protein n=1 Tax=Ornithinibacillus scapharcae TaxID=1147159 RepID=UPI000225B81C|nr:S-layer homology domain-containing protein [Ornithinibacillus scapharcae]